jgi:hypothetical protein
MKKSVKLLFLFSVFSAFVFGCSKKNYESKSDVAESSAVAENVTAKENEEKHVVNRNDFVIPGKDGRPNEVDIEKYLSDKVHRFPVEETDVVEELKSDDGKTFSLVLKKSDGREKCRIENIPADSSNTKSNGVYGSVLWNIKPDSSVAEIRRLSDNRPVEIIVFDWLVWYFNSIDEDNIICVDEGEYNSTYSKLYIPIEGSLAGKNMAVIIDDFADLVDPKSLADPKAVYYYKDCELMLLARSKSQIFFDGKTSYWFRVDGKSWIPGVSVYLQEGTFDRLPEEDLTVGIAYEKIGDGAWFTVETDDGSNLRVRETSDAGGGKILAALPNGSWVYATEQTVEEDNVDGAAGRWYRIRYPETGYVFGGYLKKHEDVGTLSFADYELDRYTLLPGAKTKFTAYEAPTTKSKVLGEYDLADFNTDHVVSSMYRSGKVKEGDVESWWIYVSEPFQGFVFGDGFLFK